MTEVRTIRKQGIARTLSSVALAALLGQSMPGAAQNGPLSDREANAIAVDAYLYFYPLVTMDLTRWQMTNLPAGKELGFGPPNTFNNARAYPAANEKIVVAPNFDTLYSVA
jgi:hypothetical protein